MSDEPKRKPQEIFIAATALVVRTYDRCLPNLAAFRTEGEAEAYRTRYGGQALRYEEARESIRQR